MSKPENEYSEAMLTFRHYSNLRFAELTLFAAINGGLGTLAYVYAGPIQSTVPRASVVGVPDDAMPQLLIFAGVGMAIIFLLLEVCLGAYLLGLRRYIVKHWPDCHMAATPRWALWPPVVLFPLSYILVLLWWWLRPMLPVPFSP